MEISLRARYPTNRRTSLTLYNKPMNAVASKFRAIAKTTAVSKFSIRTSSSLTSKSKPLPDLLPLDDIECNDYIKSSSSTLTNSNTFPKFNSQNAPNATDVSIDEGVPNVIRLTGRNEPHQDLVIEDCPMLPHQIDSTFSSLFPKKVNIISSICDFSRPEADQEAKSIKSSTINELIILYSDTKLAKTIPLSLNKELLLSIWKNIKREIPRIPFLMMCADDEPRIEEPGLPHLIPLYTLLQKLIQSNPIPDLFNSDFSRNLIKLFAYPDFNERDQLSLTLLRYWSAFPNRQEMILNEIAALLGEYQFGDAPKFVVWPCLSFLYRSMKNSNSNVADIYVKIFSVHIVPLLTSAHFVSFYPQYKLLIESFLSIHTRYTASFLKAVLNRFPTTRPGKQASFIEIINNTFSKLSLSECQPLIKPLFNIYAKCASGCVKVAEMSFQIWTRRDLIPLIMENAKVIFPIVQQPLIICSKDYWSITIQNKALTVLKAMHDIDPYLYDEISQKSRLPVEEISTKQQKSWAIVARTAAKLDRGVNLGQILSTIQLMFNVQGSRNELMMNSSNTSSSANNSSPKPYLTGNKSSIPAWR
ncbi:phosphoprotein phosphatase [Tritrichomonas foetus]|uniref:Phosphoprotein phosphatase n=1 Tax=Tritrichomonas foetus TaxID=1144522 RepID=A0A1J4JX99_9EUKA|nr:phosphoprotein phosphatase [Tritrichomonas foetus]|eukprot:OHT03777.1 phosphoprotein phosphatase [Tritrichomonas foetus]